LGLFFKGKKFLSLLSQFVKLAGMVSPEMVLVLVKLREEGEELVYGAELLEEELFA